MLKEDCRRWMTLVDRKACDEILSSAELLYVEKHAQHCADCGRESALWRTLGEVLKEPELLEQPLELPRETAEADDEAARRRPPWTKLPRWAWVASAMGTAALLAVTYGLVHHAPRPLVLAGERTPKWRLSSASGEVNFGQRPARAGDLWDPSLPLRTAQGEACATLEAAIAVCLGPDSELSLGELGPSKRSVRLLRGKVISKLTKQRPGSQYAVLTGDHAVVATGTEFVVERSSVSVGTAQAATVHLYEGTLEVKPTHGTLARITAPAAASLGSQITVGPIDASASALDAPLRAIAARRLGAQLGDQATYAAGDAIPVLEVLSHPAGARLLLDGQLIGVTPVSVLLEGPEARGSRLSLEKEGFASITEFLSTGGQTQIHRSYELAALAEKAGGEPSAPRSMTSTEARSTAERTHQASAKDLMQRSQTLRAAGKARESVDALRQLVQKFPDSPEARVSWVTLGELELTVLGQPASALRSFEAYLKLGGPLMREAQYGRIRALSGLSRQEEARRATADFIARYPNSVQTAKLRETSAVK